MEAAGISDIGFKYADQLQEEVTHRECGAGGVIVHIADVREQV